MSRFKKVKESGYQGVCEVNAKDNKPWLMRFNMEGLSCMKRYATERDAASAYDIKMMQLGREPVNIYKRK